MKLSRKNDCTSYPLPFRWPATDGWLTIADTAVRAAHAAHCTAMTLKGKPDCEDTVRFLTRRANRLLQLVDSLTTESRCEESLRQLSVDKAMEGMRQAESALFSSIRHMLSRTGLKLQIVKLLELEAIMSQASQTQVQLAMMEPETATSEAGR